MNITASILPCKESSWCAQSMIPKMTLTLFVNNDTQHKKCITSRITIFGFLLYFFEKFRIQCTIFLSE